MTGLPEGFNAGMDKVLRLLGADPDNPPPPPVKIDLEPEEIPEALRDIHHVSFGNPKTRVSFLLKGIKADAVKPIVEQVDQGAVTTREQMREALASLRI